MAFVSIAPPPGIVRNGTLLQSKGRWWDSDLMRPQENALRPVGGWQPRSAAAAFSGAARACLMWRDNSTPQPNRWIAVGTSSKLYVQDESGVNHDVTPLRKTSNPDATANPIATTIGSAVLTITDTAHGAAAGDGVIISGATAFAGLTTGNLNQTFTVLTSPAPTANTFAVNCGANATSATSGGGASVKIQYQITAGRADASQNLGYGGGTFGNSSYGVPRPNTVTYQVASVWDLDGWGEFLVGCCDTNGNLFQWSLDTATAAVAILNAPTGCTGLTVSQEGIMFALAPGGHGRRVAWSDQQNNTVWTAAATNQAGDYDLPTVGTLQCARAVPGGVLILTDIDAWLAQYVSPPLVYGFERVGSGCGPISRGAIATRGGIAAWMGKGGFWVFDGQTVQPLPCEARGVVFDNINTNQQSKVTAVHLADKGELWWLFPSASSLECDTYISWCYRESERLGRNIWMNGKLSRTCGNGRGVFDNPMMVGANGVLYEHETGLNYDGVQPYIESGPFELGKGDRLMEIQRIIPDEVSDGDLTATIYGRLWPNSPETTYPPVTLVSPTDIRRQAREVRVRYTVVNPGDARVGTMRLDVIPGDFR